MRTLAVIIALAIALPAGAQEPERRPFPGLDRTAPRDMERRQGVSDEVMEPGKEVAVYEFVRRQREPEEIIREVAAASAIVLNGRDIENIQEALKEALFADEEGGWARAEAVPQLLLRYDRELDEIRIINEEADAQDDGRMSEEEAFKVAEGALEELMARKVVDPRLYRDAAVEIGYGRVGAGSVEGEAEPGRIVEYRVTYRPRLSGVQLANTGVRLGVMASGKVASLRFGGATPVGRWDNGTLLPTGDGSIAKVDVPIDELMSRFYRVVPPNMEPMIAWSRVMYAMPEDVDRAVVPPRLLVSFAERHQTDDGEYAVSRRRVLGFSLTDPGAEPLDYTAPTRRQISDEAPRD